MKLKQALLWFWCAAAAVTAAPLAVYADVVTIVAVDGNADLAVQDVVRLGAVEALRAAGRETKELGGGDPVKPAELNRCLSGVSKTCGPQVLVKLRVDQVAFFTVADEWDREGEPTVVITGYLLDEKSGGRVVVERRFCERCSSEGLQKNAVEMTAALLREGGARQGSTTLAVRSVPKGARVLVDGEAVGTTDLEYGVYPGPHTVTVELPGYRPSVHEVVAAENAQTTVDAALVSEAPEAAAAEPTYGAWKWVVGGVGAALLGTGIVLMAVDQPRVDGDVRNRTYRPSFWPGVGTAVVGTALLGWGGYMLWQDRSTASPSRVEVSAAAGPDGAALAVAGRF